MSKLRPKIFRRYEIERDSQGMPTKMFWIGDFEVPPKPQKPTKAEQEQMKLKEWQELYK